MLAAVLPFSRLLGRRVQDAGGFVLGRLADLAVEVHPTWPRVVGILLDVDRPRLALIPWSAVRQVDPVVVLNVPRIALTPRPLQPDEVLLREALLDKQVVDTQGVRLVKVNDLLLSRSNGDLVLSGVDVGAAGLLRRLGAEGAARWLLARLGRTLPEHALPWTVVAALGGPVTPLKLRLSRERLQAIHPADLAELLEEMNRDERVEVMHALSEEDAADVLEAAETEVQAHILRSLPAERASDILGEMEADEAADVLGELPAETASDLMARMEPQAKAEVSRLLAYPPNSAGGRMNPDCIAIPATFTAEQTIARLRELAPDAETIYYLYVVDEGGRLVGVLSLRRLLIADPQTPVSALIAPEVIAVRAEESDQAAAALLMKYDLLAVPVVDAADRLLGIVAVDDVMDLLAERLGGRLPRRLERIRRVRRG
ncbi:MAG: CBS domain-containing protein [Armatimonadota bacterium]|nr:CBS domain-containing protein [Armatimonadota bacterium]MDR7426803.1 CBS domain-containing protein [Armatimonadota bacterium]MDR7463940.1 CBS domain-containing protein [Armatimonadota bacterium]MDR7469893.1 CBS domain-containing protein [Armatimonadota bacterium]MDR7474353.1 CBS domain-containing protein [Armatimonadota bacterium]